VKSAVGYLITTNGITAKDGRTDTVWQRTLQVQQTNDAQGTKPYYKNFLTSPTTEHHAPQHTSLSPSKHYK
jgi:hypothetical protein